MIRLSIVIPNYNGEKFLEGCLKSVRNQSFSDIEVILVDNGSTDGSLKILSQYPEIKIIRFETNTGFPTAVNAGIKASKGQLVGLINNDTELDPNWAETMVDAAGRYPEINLFASKMFDFYHRDTIDSAGDAISWSGRAWNIGKREKDGPKYSQEKFVFGACAGAAVYRRELFSKIGYFDEDFFFYMEDVDFSLRAQLFGNKCLYVPKAIVYHLGSATAGSSSPFTFKYINKNRWNMMYKNFPLSKFIVHLPAIFYSEVRFFVAAVRKGYLPEYFWAVRENHRDRAKMRPKRKKILRNITVSNQYLATIIH